MTRFHWAGILIFGGFGLAGLATDHSETFVLVYVGTIAIAVCGLFAWISAKAYRSFKASPFAENLWDKSKLVFFVCVFFVLPLALFIIFGDGNSYRAFDPTGQFDHLRR